jgi:hypothetical protein
MDGTSMIDPSEFPQHRLRGVGVEQQEASSTTAARAESLPMRPLGCCERFFHIYAHAFPVHFCLVAEISGEINSTKLHMAFEQVRRRHPALRACIVDDVESGPIFHGTDNPIEVRAIPIELGTDWRHVVEDELNRPFDRVPGPLMRATVLWTANGASIVLTFHHAIADALSGIRVLGDLMRAFAGEALSALRPLPPVEAMLAGLASAPGLTDGGAPPTDPTSGGGERPAPTPDRLMVNISTLEWGQEETARIVAHSKANGTTVHGAICAATARHVPPSDDDTIRLLCPFDIGGIAEIEIGNCGVFIGAGTVEVSARRGKPFWLEAGDITNYLRAVRSPEAVAGMLRSMVTAFPPLAGKEKVVEFFASQPPSSTVISNLGVLPLATAYGPLELQAVWGPAMLTNLPADRQTIGVSTFAGRLRMVHQSYQPIPGLLEAISRDLLAASV